MLSNLQDGYMSVDSDGPSFTVSSKLFASATAVDINRNTQHVSAEVKQDDIACNDAIASSGNQWTVQHSIATTTVDFMSSHTAVCSSAVLEFTPGDSTSSNARPILRPPKKRKINLTSDDSTDRCIEACQTAKCPEVSPPLPLTDLTEWKGQRVLARDLTAAVYRPGLIKSIGTSHGPIGIQFDGDEEITQTSADNVITDNAPPSSGIFVGMRVCAKIGSEQVEYRLGVVRERFLQPPVTKFLVELDACDGGTMMSPVWLSRASLRLLQVLVRLVVWLQFFGFYQAAWNANAG